MSGFMAKTIGGIPVMSEREFVEAKAARIAEDDARKAEEQAAIAEQAALEKKERTGHVRKQKSSALQRRIAAAAEKVGCLLCWQYEYTRATFLRVRIICEHPTVFSSSAVDLSTPSPLIPFFFLLLFFFFFFSSLLLFPILYLYRTKLQLRNGLLPYNQN